MTNDKRPIQKVCPRCGAPFVCHHEQPAICQCAGIHLNEKARAYLRTHYKDECLCRDCLIEINSLTA
ncbi:MAG: cysteine-rich CWC family protein [Paludibacteraceae bacterium]|nr:cysteine-rich CWC family protein [Paludibacteraceae bacterium]